MTFRQHIVRVLPAAGVAVLLMQLFWWLPDHVRIDDVFDPDVYYEAAQRRAAGEQVYGRQQRVRTNDCPAGFYYPPSALALLAPARYISAERFRYLAFGLTIVAFWALVAGLVKIATGAVSIRKTLAVGALLAVFPPITQSMNVGNLDMAVIAMVAWAFAVPAAAPYLLVAGASIKVYPAFALLALLPRADRNFRADTAVACGTAIFLTGFVLGDALPHYVYEWLTLGLSSVAVPTTHGGNWSLSTILVYPNLTTYVADVPRSARVIVACAPFAAAITAAVWLRKRPVHIAAVAALVAGTWFTSLCWWWRIFVLLTVPVAMWMREQKR